jgi:hypothetical protein
VNSILRNAAGEITCTANKAEGAMVTDKTGTMTIKFTTCTKELVNCKTAGAAAKEIVVNNAKVTIARGKEGAETRIGTLVTFAENVKITCGVAAVEVEGSVIGLSSNIAKGEKIAAGVAKKLAFTEAAGKQTPKVCESDAGFAPECGAGEHFLKAEFVAPEFKEAVQTAKDTVTFSKEVEAVF